jgi:hypothetical protein
MSDGRVRNLVFNRVAECRNESRRIVAPMRLPHKQMSVIAKIVLLNCLITIKNTKDERLLLCNRMLHQISHFRSQTKDH